MIQSPLVCAVARVSVVMGANAKSAANGTAATRGSGGAARGAHWLTTAMEFR